MCAIVQNEKCFMDICGIHKARQSLHSPTDTRAYSMYLIFIISEKNILFNYKD